MLLLAALMLLNTLPIVSVSAAKDVYLDLVRVQITPPAGGKVPDYSVSVYSSDKYTARVYEWCKDDGSTMAKSESFRDGLEYEATILVKANPGYKLNSSTNVMVNGVNKNDRTVSTGGTNYYGELIICAKFKATVKISSASAEVPVPVGGNYPSSSVSVPKGAHYSAKAISWYRVDEGGNAAIMSDNDVFEAGCKYLFTFLFVPDDGYHLTNDTKVSANGEEDITGIVSGVNNRGLNDYGELVVWVYSRALEKIFSVEAESARPVVSEHPGYSISVPSNSHYTARIASWYREDASGYFNEKMKDSETFKPNHKYQAIILFKPNDGYCMTDNTKATVNGIYENGGSIDNLGLNSNDELLIWATFEAERKEILSVEAEYTEPVIGEHPDYSVWVPSDEPYTARVGAWYRQSSDGSVSQAVSENYTFIEGQRYQAAILFTPKDGCYMTNGTKASINGIYENGGSINNRGINYKHELVVWVTFETKDEGLLPGDVNADGYIDNLDAALVLRIDSGAVQATARQEKAGDVNHDGYLDNIDAALILKYDAGDEQAF